MNNRKIERDGLVALCIAIMLRTFERVGNEKSALNGRVGISGLKKDQVTIIGNKIILEYTGKSGVEHHKMFSDEIISKSLKKAIKNSINECVFCTSYGLVIKASMINSYLSKFNVSSKDARAFGANNLIIKKLNEVEPEDTEIKRKKQFNKVARFVAKKVGHGLATLKKHYMLPELEPSFIEKGIVIDIDDVSKYNDGGTIKSDEIKVSKSADKFTCKDAIPDSKLKKSLPKEVKEILKEEYHLKKGGEISFENFHLNTEANYSSISENEIPNREPDFISESGSKYWYDSEFVIRQSDHWGELGECTWMLDSKPYSGLNQGKCLLSNFERISNIDKKLFGGVIDGNTELFETALSFKKLGFSSEKIFYETGYFIGLDGKWRSEIDDDSYTFLLNEKQLLSKYENKTIVKLGDLVSHSEFFRILPKSKDILVNLYDLDDYDFTYFKRNPEENCIAEFNYRLDYPTKFNFYSIDLYIDFKYIKEHGEERKKYPHESSIGLCTLHEMQHILQNQRGNRRSSTDSERRKQVSDEIKRARIQLQNISNSIGSDVSNDKYDLENYLNYLILNQNSYLHELYYSDPAEVEARAVVQRFIRKNKSFPSELNYSTESMKKGGSLNPYAVCTTSIGKKEGTTKRSDWSESGLDKYESCVLKVKAKMSNGGELRIDKKKVYEGERMLRDMDLSEVEKYIGIYHEKEGNMFFAKNKFLIWFYDITDFAPKINSEEFDFLMFPNRMKGFSFNSVGIIDEIWTKKWQNKYKGAKHLLGMIQGYYDENNNRIVIHFMSVRPTAKRNHINSFMVQYAKKAFNSNDVVFHEPTKQGQSFIDSNKFKQGGDLKGKIKVEVDYELLAPNGKPSNLTAEQYKLVRSPEFISWFGNWIEEPETASKVVDENGEPKECYHGTIKGGFTKFDSKLFPTVGYFAEDFNFSKNFILVKKRYRSDIENEMIYNVFLSIKNPIDLTSIKDGYEDISMEEFIKHLPYEIDSFHDTWANQIIKIELPLIAFLANNDIIDSFKRNGYDGVKFHEGTIENRKEYQDDEFEVTSTVSWISFYPEQIKLSDGTNTTFDKNNSDIRFEYGGGLSKTPSPKEDRIYGSKINKPNSSESKNKAESIILSENVLQSIESILKKHNDDNPNKKIPISTAKAVVRRGMGAYSSTHRPTISGGKPNSRVAWGLARLNAFVYKIQNGKSKSGKYNQDDDLIKELGYSIEKLENGGSVSFDKVISASSRFRPTETVVFDPPLEGKNGAKLISYTWSYEWTMKPNYEGELVSKRVSDWSQAEISAETGRDIVHQYTVLMPDGEYKTVSSDSVPVLLGYIDRKELKSFPNLVTASKTLAKQQMQLAIMEAQKKEYDELYNKFENAEKPEIKEVGENSKFSAVIESWNKGAYSNYAMGDIIHRQDNDYIYETKEYKKRPLSKDTIEQLTSFWISERVKEAGGINPRGIYDLKNRVARQKRKVENILNAKMEHGGEFSDFDQDYYEDAYRDRSEGTVIRQVYDSGILKSNERYIFSREKEIKFRETKQEQEESSKPEGLWYSIGNEWAKEVSTKLDFLADRYDYVHKIKITDKVLLINTIDEAIDFTKKYGVKEPNSYIINRFLIKWTDVAKDYSGIEVKDPDSWCRIDESYTRIEHGNEKSYELRDLFWWMFSWDVASGCIWKEDGIQSIELFDWEQEIMDSYGQFKNGGSLSIDEKDDVYKEWKELINMSYSELKEFYDSEEGKVAGLKKSEADELGIHSGRESARWIMKMKKTKREDWTNEMWGWAKRQINFVKRMSGAKGDLIDEKGNKTRKYLSLLIWGNNPLKIK